MRFRKIGRIQSSGSRLAGVLLALSSTSLVLAACGSSPTASNSSSSSGSSTATTLAGASYFKGKTITLISPYPPGGDYDLYPRIFAPELSKILHATVNVEDVSGGGGLVGVNQMSHSAPNGLTLGLVNTTGVISDVIAHAPGVNFNVNNLSWIGQPGTVPYALITKPNSSITSFSGLLHASKPVTVLDDKTGGDDPIERVVFGAFNIPHTLLTGFAGAAAIKQGFLNNEGQLLFQPITAYKSFISSGQAKVLLLSASPQTSYLKTLGSGAPTIKEELSKARPSSAAVAAVKEELLLSKLEFDFAGPPGIPPARLSVLRQAFLEAAQASATKVLAQKDGEVISPVSGATLASEVSSAVKEAQIIKPYIG